MLDSPMLKTGIILSNCFVCIYCSSKLMGSLYMTGYRNFGAADDFFWTFEQVERYYKFAVVNYIGFHDKGMVLAGGCGDTNGSPKISVTDHIERAHQFGRTIYADETA